MQIYQFYKMLNSNIELTDVNVEELVVTEFMKLYSSKK
jgi:hypothetical protein